MKKDEKLLRQELDELQKQLDDSRVYQREDYPQIAKRHKELTTLIRLLEQRLQLGQQRQATEKLAQEEDTLAQLARKELEQIDDELAEIERQLAALSQEQEPAKEARNCIVEIRAGVGGSESSLFAADLYRMYTRYGEKQGWKMEIITQSSSDVGGFKEIIFEVHGRNAYVSLKFESGVHRVQRVPSTESQGRVHTSTASVAVLAKIAAAELEIKPSDLRIDTYRSGGHGGQSVNKTDSAVRITHLPTGMIATCQDEKSQFKNKERALSVLRARLLDKQQAEQEEAASSTRKKLIGRAFRNEKIRTYNFPQDRLTDHRINLNLSKLPDIMSGQLQPLIDGLSAYEEESHDA